MKSVPCPCSFRMSLKALDHPLPDWAQSIIHASATGCWHSAEGHRTVRVWRTQPPPPARTGPGTRESIVHPRCPTEAYAGPSPAVRRRARGGRGLPADGFDRRVSMDIKPWARRGIRTGRSGSDAGLVAAPRGRCAASMHQGLIAEGLPEAGSGPSDRPLG